MNNKKMFNISKTNLQKWIKEGLKAQEMADKIGCSKWTIMKKCKELNLTLNGPDFHNKGDNNPAKRPEVREKISQSVKNRWDEGTYIKRINGIKGMLGEKAPRWKPEIHEPLYLAKNKYRDFLSQYEDVDSCRRCGSKNKINIHHIDENHDNFLPSNLEPLCVGCHSSFHYSLQKRPFLLIGKIFSFAAAHHLPNYNGPCSRWHGHEWSLEIIIRKRVDPKTEMVMDFSQLKQLVENHIISILDHHSLNDIIKNPTAENIMLWIWEKLVFDAHLKGLHKIRLWETPNSVAELNQEDMLSVLKSNIEYYWKK